MKYLEISLPDNMLFIEMEYLGKFLTECIASCHDAFLDILSTEDNCSLLRDGIIKYLSAVYQINILTYWDKDVDSIKNKTDYLNSHLKIRIIKKDEIATLYDSRILYVPICTLEDLEHGINWFIV